MLDDGYRLVSEDRRFMFLTGNRELETRNLNILFLTSH